MKKKILFIIINLILVGIVGALVGILCKDRLSDTVALGGFIILLVSLVFPSLIYFVSNKFGQAALITSVLFTVFEIATGITFLSISCSSNNPILITEAVEIGLFLIVILVIVATYKKEEK